MTIAAYSIQALHDEIHNDPKTLYAAAKAGGDLGAMQVILNGLSGPGIGVIPHEPISGSGLLALIDPNELAVLTIPQNTTLKDYLDASLVSIGDSKFQTYITGLFPQVNAPNTFEAVVAASTRIGTRAEVLWGANKSVSLSDLQAAQPF